MYVPVPSRFQLNTDMVLLDLRHDTIRHDNDTIRYIYMRSKADDMASLV